MANFGLGLAQGFELGTRMQEAYRKRRMREAFEEAQADKQRRAYTPEQGEQMRREAAMVDEFGNPLYEFSIEPGSTTYTRRELRYPNARAAELPQMSLADQAEPEVPAPRSLGTRYITPVGQEPYVRDTIGETDYDVDTRGFRNLSPQEAAKVYAHPNYDPNLSANAQYDMLFGPQPRRGLSVSGPESSSALLPPEVSRVQQRLGREYGDSMMYTPQATQYLGQTYGAEGLTPAQQRAALMNRYADIISKYESPVEGERFRSMARAEERAEETYGLTKRKAEREERIAVETENVYKAMGEYQEKFPNATPMEIYDHLKKQKLSTAAINKVVADIAGVGENELKMYNTAIDKIITKTGGSYAALKNAYNTNDMLDPTTNIVDRKTKDGKLVVDFVSADDPNKVLSSFTFNDETEAAAFLATNAKNPVVAAEMLANTRYKRALTRQAESRADYLDDGGPRRGTGRDYSIVERNQEIAGLIRYRDSAARDAARLREDVNNMRPNDPNYAQTVARYNAADALVQKLDRDIQDLRSGGGLTRGGGAAPERYEPGKVYSFRDEKGNVKDYRLKEGKTGAAPEDWEEAKAAPAPKAEAEVKTAPAKEEPPKKDTTKYIREKSPRGTYTYTESPRGLTREQWAQLDEEKKRK